MSSSSMTLSNRTSWREPASVSLTSDITTDQSGCLSTQHSAFACEWHRIRIVACIRQNVICDCHQQSRGFSLNPHTNMQTLTLLLLLCPVLQPHWHHWKHCAALRLKTPVPHGCAGLRSLFWDLLERQFPKQDLLGCWML